MLGEILRVLQPILNETRVDFKLFQQKFPNAKVVAPTLTDYFKLLNNDTVNIVRLGSGNW